MNRALYGLLKAGLHWYRTYQKHHVEALKLNAVNHNSCSLYTKGVMSSETRSRTDARGFKCLQTDDSAIAGNERFALCASMVEKRFDRKPFSTLSDVFTIKFNGTNISLKHSVYTISVGDHLRRLEEVAETIFETSEFITQRPKVALIAAVGRPDLSFGFSVATKIENPDTNATVQLNRHIREAKRKKQSVLRFVMLDDKTIRIAAFSDAFFASNGDPTS